MAPHSSDTNHAAVPQPRAGTADPHGGVGKYIAVFVILCCLTAASFFASSKYWPFEDPHIAWAFMIAVSCAKATLVILFFMHLLWEANWKYVLTIPAVTMSCFLVLMLIPDVGRRVRMYSEERQVYAAEAPPGPGQQGTEQGRRHGVAVSSHGGQDE